MKKNTTHTIKTKSWGFDIKNIDMSVRPQDDFFHYAIGGWLDKNSIPESKARWGTFDMLRERVAKQLHAIVNDIIKNKKNEEGSEDEKMQNFFLSGMNIKERNARGLSPVKKYLNLVGTIVDSDSLKAVILKLHKEDFTPLFAVMVGQDDRHSEKNITFLSQNGLSLGERDFYLKKDARSEEVRAAFLLYATSLFSRMGIDKEQAQVDAKKLLTLETKLARVSMTGVDRRDITKVYNKMSVAQLTKRTSMFAWRELLDGVGLKTAQQVVVCQPEYFEKAVTLLESVPIETWKAYLRFYILDTTRGVLTTALEKDAFAFYGVVMSGRRKMEPRWKRILGTVDGAMSDALGKKYVARHFPPEAKKTIEHLVGDLITAYEKRIKDIDWMTDATKKKALRKLQQINPKFGYPDTWKSYKSLKVDPQDYFGNVMRANRLERLREFKKLDKPVDRSEWHMSPHTVNAYYSPNLNDIVFPAGILQPPFFSPKVDAAVNYGAIGSVIGHEITHGFDDQGCLFDGKGNYKNWWTKEDHRRFTQKAKKLVAQFNTYCIHGQPVNGKLTLGENIADLGGISIAFDAYMEHLRKTDSYAVIGGLTPEQRFFLSTSMFECGHERKESALMMLVLDPHAPPVTRVNGPCSNLPEFYEAWGVSKGDKMYREAKERVKIW